MRMGRRKLFSRMESRSLGLRMASTVKSARERSSKRLFVRAGVIRRASRTARSLTSTGGSGDTPPAGAGAGSSMPSTRATSRSNRNSSSRRPSACRFCTGALTQVWRNSSDQPPSA